MRIQKYRNKKKTNSNIFLGIPEPPGRPLTVAFTSRSVNLSWAPPFNADHVGVAKYLIEVRAGEETPWKDSSLVTAPNNITLYQVRTLIHSGAVMRYVRYVQLGGINVSKSLKIMLRLLVWSYTSHQVRPSPSDYLES